MSMNINTIVSGGGLLGNVYDLARQTDNAKVNFGLKTGFLSGKTVVKSNVGASKGGGIREAMLKAFDAVNISSEAKQQIKEILLMGAKSGKEVRGNAISGADALKAFDIAAKGFLGLPKAPAQEPQVPIAKRTIQQVTEQSAPASPQNVKLASEIVGYLSTKRFASPDGKPLLSPKETETLTNTLSRHGVLLDSFRKAVQTKNTAARDKLLRDIVTQFASKSLFSSSAHPPISRNSARRMMVTDMTNFAGELFGLTRDEKYKVWDALNKDFRLTQSNPEKAQRFLQNWEANYKAGKGHGLLAIVVNQTLGKGRATKGVLGQKPGATKEFFKAAFGEAPKTEPKTAPKTTAKELFGFFGKKQPSGGIADDFVVMDDEMTLDVKTGELLERAKMFTAAYNAMSGKEPKKM